MKKKPHQKQSAIKKVFSDFRDRLHDTQNPSNEVDYEVKKQGKGYSVTIHKERGANQTLHFDSKEDLDNHLSTL